MNAAAAPPEPLSLFNADALILLGAIGLLLLLAGIVAMLSWHAKSRVVALAGMLVVLILMAFLPFWSSLLWLFFPQDQQLAALSSSYLWLTFAAVIHLERVFTFGTLLSGIVYFAIPGAHRTRLLRTLACLAVLVLVAIAHVVVQLHGHGLLGR
ncbi:MAG TPA: hypothetical protein VFZ95_07710 [Steroidobacteraceae bacterium]